MSRKPITARISDGVSAIPAADWDACAGAANPFVGHTFLSILEESGSVGPGTGWQPLPIIVDGADGRPAAVAPAYAKSHSQGEYVFDHAWADAWERAGGNYYPKLQVAAPFTPAPGPRLLLRDPDLAELIGNATRRAFPFAVRTCTVHLAKRSAGSAPIGGVEHLFPNPISDLIDVQPT